VNEIFESMRDAGGVIDRRSNRDLAAQLDGALRRGRLVAVLPGIYCVPEAGADTDTRIRAALIWAGAGAVLTGWAAARIAFWPSVAVTTVTVALPTTGPRARSWLRFERRTIPDELVCFRGGFAVTKPCLTAVDLAATRAGGICIDQALRTRTATLPQMWDALRLTPSRTGNAMRFRMLQESKHEPWSEPEPEAHGLLDAARITGWVTNAPVLSYYVDILFKTQRLIIEVDGWEVHGTRLAFESDRRRRDELEAAGYRVLNFTARQIRSDPEWVIAIVRKALGR
jgi:very-short-patch-repair endonuclease